MSAAVGGRRTLWVDASQGASGDMLLGALVDLGVPLGRIRRAVTSLPLDGFSLRARRVERCALVARKVDVRVRGPQPARGWRELRRIIEAGELARGTRQLALAVFRRLIEAEAAAHGRPFERAHLHEAGGTDAIVDVVGVAVGLEALEVERIVVSPMTTGFGEVRCAHGTYPVPAPATLGLVREAPVRGGELEGERLTPTGAAILTTIADAWGGLPAMRPQRVGYGAGEREYATSPNLLRLVLGEASEPAAAAADGDAEIVVVECTVDDATPQTLAWAAERLFDAGALDVWTSAVTMKKGRSGHVLTALGRPAELGALAEVLLRETSTLGVRHRLERRLELEREIRRVRTRFGAVGVKVGSRNGSVLQAWPEYEDCARLARESDVPLATVQRAALDAWGRRTREPRGRGR